MGFQIIPRGRDIIVCVQDQPRARYPGCKAHAWFYLANLEWTTRELPVCIGTLRNENTCDDSASRLKGAWPPASQSARSAITPWLCSSVHRPLRTRVALTAEWESNCSCSLGDSGSLAQGWPPASQAVGSQGPHWQSDKCWSSFSEEATQVPAGQTPPAALQQRPLVRKASAGGASSASPCSTDPKRSPRVPYTHSLPRSPWASGRWYRGTPAPACIR